MANAIAAVKAIAAIAMQGESRDLSVAPRSSRRGGLISSTLSDSLGLRARRAGFAPADSTLHENHCARSDIGGTSSTPEADYRKHMDDTA